MAAYWSKCSFSDYAKQLPVEMQFDQQWIQLYPHIPSVAEEMLLCCAFEGAGSRTLYMRLPAAILPYPGFTAVADKDLPDGLVFLLGDKAGFERFVGSIPRVAARR